MSIKGWASFKRGLARKRRAILGQQSRPPQLARDKSEALVTRVFRSILRREPDASGLHTYSNVVTAGRMDSLDLAEAILASPEFGVRALQHPPAARHVASVLIAEIVGRIPDEATVSAYALALENGYSLSNFVQELMASEEFRDRFSASPKSPKLDANLMRVGQLTEQLIGERLLSKGCVIGLPPQPTDTTAPTEQQVARLVRTLAMLGDDQSASQVETEAA